MRAYNTTDLAKIYGVSYPTIKKWISSISELGEKKSRRVFTPRELELIFRSLGQPINCKGIRVY